MGNTIIKSVAEEVQYTSSTTLYRIGNLRILAVNGASPTNVVLYECDRPKTLVVSSAVTNSSDGNLNCAMGKIAINTNGTIQCLFAAYYYYSASAGYGVLSSPNTINGVAIWTV